MLHSEQQERQGLLTQAGKEKHVLHDWWQAQKPLYLNEAC